jgi:hypothetical protein
MEGIEKAWFHDGEVLRDKLCQPDNTLITWPSPHRPLTPPNRRHLTHLTRDAGTTGAAGASAPVAFCIFNFVGAVRVQTRGATGAQNFYNRQN